MQEAAETPAIIFNEVDYPWASVSALSEALSLLMQGADPTGSSVALVMRNRPVSVAALIAILAEHRCAILISPIQPSASLCAEVRALKPSLLIADRDDWRPELDVAIREVGGAGLEIFAEGQALRVALRKGAERAGSGMIHRPPDDAAILSPTSGTTGPPRRAPLSWTWLDDQVPSDDIPIKRHRPIIQAVPLYTAGGIRTLCTSILRPLPLVLMERLDVSRWADLIERYKPRRAGLPPAGLQMILDAGVPKEKFASLEAWHTGAAPVPPELAEALEDAYGVPVLITYGATEFGAVARWTVENRRALGRIKRGSSGQALPGCELRVVDPVSGEVLPANETGILEVHTSDRHVIADGYWIRTTDLAHIDEDGFLFVEGRVDDVIIRGGFKVPLFALEAAVREHPGVADCAAVALPDPRLGQAPGMVVVLREECVGQVSAAALIGWLRDRVPSYQIPTRLEIVDSLPLSPSMKVSRPDVRNLLLNELSDRR